MESGLLECTIVGESRDSLRDTFAACAEGDQDWLLESRESLGTVSGTPWLLDEASRGFLPAWEDSDHSVHF